MNGFLLILALVGIVMIGYAMATGVVAMRSKDWPVVNGRITQSAVTMDREMSRQLQSGRLGLQFAYSYEVDGEELTGSRVSFGNTAVLQKFTMHYILSRYQPDTVVPVYYAPNRPGLTVLEPGFKWTILIQAAIGLLLVIPLFFAL